MNIQEKIILIEKYYYLPFTICDLYLVRRILDKDYVNKAIVYTEKAIDFATNNKL